MFRLTEKKYLCSGNKEDFDEMDFLDFFCMLSRSLTIQ